jgi:predicted nucleotidyltransferase
VVSVLERQVRARAEWLTQAADQLAADERVEAVVLAGSLARGGGDAWSDIDLIVCVNERDRASTVEATQPWVSAFGSPLYVLEAKWNAPVGAAQLNTLYDLDDGLPLYVDWNLWPVPIGVTASNTSTLFERRPGLLPSVGITIEEWWDGLERQRVPGGSACTPDALAHFQFGMLPIAAKYCARRSVDERQLALIGADQPPSTDPEEHLVAIRSRLAELAPRQPRAAVAAIERLCDTVESYLADSS